MELRSCSILLLSSSCLLLDLSIWNGHILNPLYDNNNNTFIYSFIEGLVSFYEKRLWILGYLSRFFSKTRLPFLVYISKTRGDLKEKKNEFQNLKEHGKIRRSRENNSNALLNEVAIPLLFCIFFWNVIHMTYKLDRFIKNRRVRIPGAIAYIFQYTEFGVPVNMVTPCFESFDTLFWDKLIY